MNTQGENIVNAASCLLKDNKIILIRMMRNTGLPVFFLVCLALPARGWAQSMKRIYASQDFSVWADRVEEGSYSARAVSRSEIESNYPATSGTSGIQGKWVQKGDLSEYPKLRSEYPLLDALYNLSLEELQENTRPDGAFDAGAKWKGVWTRDTSYSILLSLAAIQPEAAKASLLQKVKRDRIVQDTGTGGSWPVSTDRVTWSLAAWEIYLVTGEGHWLQQSYAVIRNSILDDEQVVMDPATGLAHGESSFMDWREQTYPRWMEPVDIYSSEALGTNAVYYRTYRILASMAQELGQPSGDWNSRADRIRIAMNQRLWIKSRGYYGQYLYGRVWQTLSPRADALGESLAVLFDIPSPEQQDQIIRSQPLMEYGLPTVFPETPSIPPYHNRSVWPFVQAFWNLAVAKREDGDALLYGLASIYRASALFMTNKENFVSDTGDAAGTVINSDRQLWSVAGNLAMNYRVLFGMEFAVDGLHLHPVVPEALDGTRTLTNFHYRAAILSIKVRGFGSKIRSVTIDGNSSSPVIPATLIGKHRVVIELADQPLRSGVLHLVKSTTAPETPGPQLKDKTLIWKAVEGAAKYQVYRDGGLIATTTSTSFATPDSNGLAQYQVAAVDSSGVASFLSEPAALGGKTITVPVVTAGSDQTEPFATLEQSGETGLLVSGEITRSRRYSLTFRYANGSGPISTDNKCAIRTLFIDGREVGPVVFPQRGTGAWDDWGMSNSQLTQLHAGMHRFELRFLPQDINMNGEVNRVRIASISLVALQ